MKETAEDILKKHNVTGMTELLIPILKEIADKAWEACEAHKDHEWMGDFKASPDKETFMKELFHKTKEI